MVWNPYEHYGEHEADDLNALIQEVAALKAENARLRKACEAARPYVETVAEKVVYTNVTKPKTDLALIDKALENS